MDEFFFELHFQCEVRALTTLVANPPNNHSLIAIPPYPTVGNPRCR